MEGKTEVVVPKILRNNSKIPLSKNGRHRHGQFGWHNENCEVENTGIQRLSPEEKYAIPLPHRRIWCATHGQWAIETPVRVVFSFEDGTIEEYKI